MCAHNVAARYAFNLSADALLPKALSRVHKHHQSPHVASVAVTAGCFVVLAAVVITGTGAYAFYAAMLGIVSLGMLCIFFLCNAAVAVHLRRARGRLGALQRYLLPGIAGVGLGASVVLGVLNFQLLTGGSALLSNVLLVSSV